MRFNTKHTIHHQLVMRGYFYHEDQLDRGRTFLCKMDNMLAAALALLKEKLITPAQYEGIKTRVERKVSDHVESMVQNGGMHQK